MGITVFIILTIDLHHNPGSSCSGIILEKQTDESDVTKYYFKWKEFSVQELYVLECLEEAYLNHLNQKSPSTK